MKSNRLKNKGFQNECRLTFAFPAVVPPTVARPAETRGDSQNRLANFVLLKLARGVVAHDARVDPATQ